MSDRKNEQCELDESQDRVEVRRALLIMMITSLPGWFIALYLNQLAGTFSERPYATVGVLLPIVGIAFVAWRLLLGDRDMILSNKFAVFFLAYCMFFSVAASSDLLTWKRNLIGYEDSVPRNWLGINRIGDWRYWLMREAPPANDIVLLALPAMQNRDQLRFEIARIISQAIKHGVGAIALDYYFEQESEIDNLLCNSFREASESGVPVLVGYRHELIDNVPVKRRLPATLQECVPQAWMAHLAGYAEWDGIIRMIPLYLRGHERLGSMSYKMAQYLRYESVAFPTTDPGKPLELPANKLVQFSKPERIIDTQKIEKFLKKPDAWQLVDSSLLVVGTISDSDVYPTPFGRLHGMTMHAYAAHSIRGGYFIRRLHEVWKFPTVFTLCYLLIGVYSRGVNARRFLGFVLMLTLAVVVISVLAIGIIPLWVDVSYPLAAIWLLALFLLGSPFVRAISERLASRVSWVVSPRVFFRFRSRN